MSKFLNKIGLEIMIVWVDKVYSELFLRFSRNFFV